MRNLQAKFFGPELQALVQTVGSEPISIEADGKPVAIILSAKAYGDLIGGRGGHGHRRYRALTTDANELFGLPGDMFNND